jgi:hypothetical protein
LARLFCKKSEQKVTFKRSTELVHQLVNLFFFLCIVNIAIVKVWRRFEGIVLWYDIYLIIMRLLENVYILHCLYLLYLNSFDLFTFLRFYNSTIYVYSKMPIANTNCLHFLGEIKRPKFFVQAAQYKNKIIWKWLRVTLPLFFVFEFIWVEEYPMKKYKNIIAWHI